LVAKATTDSVWVKKETGAMDRRLALKALAALAGLPLAAPARVTEATVPLTIRVNIAGPHILSFLPIEIIPVLGIDRALGAQLAIRYLPSGVQSLEDVLAGNAHFAGVAFPVLPTFAAQGKRVRAVAKLSSGTPPYAVLVRNDLAGRIRDLRDLRGRSIGIPMGSATTRTYLQTLMELWLESYGVKAREVRWVPTNMNYDGMFGALAGGAVDAVFCEEPLSGSLARKRLGTQLASLADPKNPARIVGRQHLRAVIASTAEVLDASPRRAEVMVDMVRRALRWVRSTPPGEVVSRLGISDAQVAEDIIDAMTRLPDMYSADGLFLASEIESTRQFLQASGNPVPTGMDLRSLIVSPRASRRS
jgi:ABC-type nitrate/sulfonate/bicarbonate transport system substrate-binding protein